jgi:hypothetical protein
MPGGSQHLETLTRKLLLLLLHDEQSKSTRPRFAALSCSTWWPLTGGLPSGCWCRGAPCTRSGTSFLQHWMIGVLFPDGCGNFSLRHHVQIDSGVHPASYAKDTSGCFSGVKRPGRKADHSPPCSAEIKECVEVYLHSPNTYS